MREREVEAYLARRVKALGGEVRKVQWVGRRGAPDRLVLLKRHGVHCYVELKRPKGGLLEAHQVREHERMRQAGCVVFTAYTPAEVDDVIEWLLS